LFEKTKTVPTYRDYILPHPKLPKKAVPTPPTAWAIALGAYAKASATALRWRKER